MHAPTTFIGTLLMAALVGAQSMGINIFSDTNCSGDEDEAGVGAAPQCYSGFNEPCPPGGTVCIGPSPVNGKSVNGVGVSQDNCTVTLWSQSGCAGNSLVVPPGDSCTNFDIQSFLFEC